MAVKIATAVLLLAGIVCGDDGAMSPQYDTIVVGLGSAGATAASTLARAGRRVLALEAMDRVGGRVNTVPFGDGVVEVGAEWIHGTTNSRVYDLAMQNNVTLLPQDLQFRVFQSDGGAADEALVNELVVYCLRVLDDPPDEPEPLGHFITRKLMDHLRESKPEVIENKDFLEQFLELMNLIINNYEASNDWNDVSAWSKYDELDENQHMSWNRNGYKTFFDILLNKYNNGTGHPTLETKLNTEVTLIKWPQDPAQKVEVTCKDGTVYAADNVIVTVSLGVLKERYTTLFSQQLPEDKVTAIEKISMGVLGKVIFSFPHRWWSSNFSSFQIFWTNDDKKALPADDQWLTKLSGPSASMGNDLSLTFWSCGDNAKLLPAEKESVIEKIPMGVLVKIILSFPRAWWADKNTMYNVCWRRKDQSTVASDDQWTLKLGGPTTPMGCDNAVTMWISGDNAKHTTLFSPKLPKDKATAIDKVAMGLIDKIILSFPYAWWPRDVSFYGFLWRGSDKRAAEGDWTSQIFGASSPLSSGNCLTLWTNGNNSKLVETLPEDVIKRKCMELLRRFMGANTTIPEPTGIIRSTWYSNPYTRGSYTYDNLLVAQYPNARAALAAPLADSAGRPRVLFAGEATDETHFSTVHGASDSGYREAMRLLPTNSKI